VPRQKITSQPRELLKRFECKVGLNSPKLVVLRQRRGLQSRGSRRWPTNCSTGAQHIRSTGATSWATGNPGCLLQLINGAKKIGLPLRVVHPVALLAEAYRAASGDPTERILS